MLTGDDHLITRRVYADIFVDPQWSHCGSASGTVVPLRSKSNSTSVHFLGLPLFFKVSAFAEAISQTTGIPCFPHHLRLICKDDLNPTLKTRVSHSIEWRLEGTIDDPQGILRSKVLSTDIVYRARIQILQDHRLDGRGFFSHDEGVVYLIHPAGMPNLPADKQTATLPEWNNESFFWQGYPL
ncbi:hypothetical protein BGZ73_008928 [Actinomortierella ambigua]|nr:hypothetical protein BGZ73_008928 [Actinomortierella ambigua]